MLRRTLTLVLLAVVVALAAGCGSSGGVTATSVANCLNAKSFLVRPQGATVDGVSTSGVAFTLTLYETPGAARAAGASLNGRTSTVTGRAVVDFQGNAPIGGHPSKLTKAETAAITKCVR